MPAFISNSGYSASQISAMQQDAVERVREMQRRAREKLEGSNQVSAVPVRQQPVQQAAYRQPSPAPAAPAAPAPPAQPFQGFLEKLGLDGETALILILLFLLINEGADQTLILALVYILMV